MALTVKMGSAGRKAGDLAMGESVEGYIIGLAETKFNFAIKLLTKNGNVETLYPNGNLSYIEQEIEDGNVALNAYTKITRTGTRQSTKSRDPQTGEWRQVPVFQVAQDADDVVSSQDAAEALASDKAETPAAVPAETDVVSSDEGASKGSGGKFANRARR